MADICKRVLSFFLALCLTVTLFPVAYAAETTEGTDGELAIPEEIADQIIESVFGETTSEAVKTDTGYEYTVPAEAFAPLTDSIEAAAAEENIPAEEESSNELPADYVDNSNEELYQLLAELKKNPIPMAEDKETKVEVVFVIDSTGSMGSYISSTKNNVAEFARYLAEKDITLRLGLIDYRDITCDGADSTVVHSANHSNWMDVTNFVSELSKVTASAGGDAPETPIDALAHLTGGTMAWSSDAYKFAVLITDAGYKNNNNHGIANMDDMISRLQAADIQVTTITRSSYTSTYGNLAGYTGGIQATLSSNFASILKDYADSIIGGAQATQNYTLRVLEETTKLPVKGASVSWSGGSGTTNDDGMVTITSRNNPIRTVKITRSGYVNFSQSSLELEKGGLTIVTMEVDDSSTASADGVPVLKPSHFQNPESGSGGYTGPVFRILGKDFNPLKKASFSFALDVFSNKTISIKHDKDNKKFEVIFGREFAGKDPADSEVWKARYKEYKALVSAFSDKTPTEIYNDFRAIKSEKTTKADIAAPVDVMVGGYANVSYADGNLNWSSLEGGFILGVSMTPKDLVNVPIPAFPYAFVKVTFELDGKAKFGLAKLETTGKVGLTSTITVEPSLAGTLNLGSDLLASVGGGLKGTLNTKIKVPFVNLADNAEVKLTGSFVYNVKLLGFKHDGDFPLAELDIYPGKSGKSVEALSVVDASDFSLISRPSASGIMPLADASDFDYYQSNAYTDSAPQLLKLTDGSWLLVWLGAAAGRSDNDMSTLYYSVSTDGSTWSDAKIVSDDGTGDFMPSLALSGDGTPVLAWQNSSKVYGDAALDLETRAKDIQLSVSFFDAASGSFGESVSLTSAENTVCEMAAHAAKAGTGAAVYWLENSANSLLLAEGTTSIYSSTYDPETATWGEPVLQISGISGLNMFTAGEISGDSFVAYTQNESKYIYYRNITDNRTGSRTAANAPSDLQITGNKLYWSDNNGLRSWNQSSTYTLNKNLTNVNFTVVPGESTTIALFRNSSGLVSEYSAAIVSSTSTGKPVPITDYGMMLGTPSAVMDGNTIRFAAGRTAVDTASNTLGASDLVVDSHTFQANVIVDETAFVDTFSDLTQETMEVSVDITNNGLATSGKLKAVFYRDGAPAGESTLKKVNPDNPSSSSNLTAVAPGETVWAYGVYTLPAERTEHTLQVQIVDAGNGTVYGTASVLIPGGAPDITVQNVTVTRNDAGAAITATILNEGLAAAENVTAVLTQEGAELTQTVSVGALAVGASQEVSFQVGPDTLGAASAYDYKRFTVTGSTETPERMVGNNSGDALLAPIPVTGIALEGQESITLEVGDTYNYTYTILPLNAPKQSVSWMSSDTSVATVENGVVTARKPGNVTITVVTFDQEGNKLTDTATVAVKGKVNVSVTGVAISEGDSAITAGQSIQLHASVLPENATNQRITWTTSTPDLVTLTPSEDTNQVTVTALETAEGTAVIAARSADGDYTDSVNIHISQRVSGNNRLQTAFEAANNLKDVLGVSSFDSIILASGTNFADALAGSHLAAVKSAPILLSTKNSDQANLEYVQANLTYGGTVYILGGTAAVPQSIEDLLVGNGITVQRLAGENRLMTNLQILEAAGFAGGEVLVVTSRNFADSLSASATGKPILLVNNNWTQLSEDYVNFLSARSCSFTIIGGTAAVNESIEADLANYGSVSRIFGNNRQATSVEVAKRYFASPSTVFLAYSKNFPDGLCGGPLAYAMGAPLLLVCSGKEAAAAAYVSAYGIKTGHVMGGTGVIDDNVVAKVFG